MKKTRMNTKPSVTRDEVEEWFEDEASEAPTPARAQVLESAEKYGPSQRRVVRKTMDYQLDYLKRAPVCTLRGIGLSTKTAGRRDEDSPPRQTSCHCFL